MSTKKPRVTQLSTLAGIVGSLLLVIAALVSGLLISDQSNQVITGFDSCRTAQGSIIQETYPARCITKDGVTFTQIVP
jgi:hypothetical protein